MNKLIGLMVGIFMFGVVGSANALTIVNLDSLTATTSDPVVLSLTAGTYDVTPIGVADGGNYNSWSPWGTSHRQVHKYSVEIDGLIECMTDGNTYYTELEALANAVSMSFTITSDKDISFFIHDSNYTDNTGGISLTVGPPSTQPVPEPCTMLLFGTGLAGIAGLRKRLKK